jgi:hypothetical protein
MWTEARCSSQHVLTVLCKPESSSQLQQNAPLVSVLSHLSRLSILKLAVWWDVMSYHSYMVTKFRKNLMPPSSGMGTHCHENA